ncbi:MAG TPA: hypothetical protein VLI90_19545 [Tepidisphaeraceae bacterium]|nr:hypothetical protein [Tepidisphaeraceae bacterium]
MPTLNSTTAGRTLLAITFPLLVITAADCHPKPSTNATKTTPVASVSPAPKEPSSTEPSEVTTPAPVTTEPTAEATTAPTTELTAEAPVTQPANEPAVAAVTPSPETTTAMPGAAAAGVAAGVTATAATEPATRPTTEATTEPTTSHTAAAAGAPPLNPAPPTTNPTEIEGDRVLAEQFASIAQAAIPSKVPAPELWQPMLQQVAAILQAANKLDPTNARVGRLLADADLRLHDDEGAIDALRSVRAADPKDEFAQAQTIDLYANKMDTAEAKIAYLKTIMGTPTVPDGVRAHAAVVCAKLLVDRGQEEQGKNVLGEALRANPLSGEGLRLRYQLLSPTASHFERASALMELIRANPGQAAYTEMLADQFAESALVAESVPWYNLALNISARTGHPSISAATKQAAALFIAGDANTANQMVDNILTADPANVSIWFLKLAIVHSSAANKDDFTKVLQQARNAMSNRVIELVNQIGGTTGDKPTTRPITAEGPYTLPDLRLTIAKINQDAPPELKEAFTEAVSRLAMLETYFAQDPEAGSKLIDVLKQIRPDDDPAVARLEGWLFLIQGKNDEAKVKFSAIAAQDPMATLGLIRMESNKELAATLGRKLVSDYPSGLIGGILWDGLRPLGVKIVTSKQADALRQIGEQFPKDFMHVLDQPQSFYAVHVDPLVVARDYDEPLLARLSIVNMGNADLTIGSEGVIRPDLWFNAQVKGIVEQSFVGTALDRVAGPMVLRSRQSTAQVIRLDQGPLLQFLQNDPTVAFEVYGSVVTNPLTGPKGELSAGPGGYAVKFSKVMNRSAAPPDGPAPQRAIAALQDGKPADKINAVNLLSSYVRSILSKKDVPDAVKQKTLGLVQMILKAREDRVPAVAATANYQAGRLLGGDQAKQLIQEMSRKPDWRQRVVALMVIDQLPMDAQKDLATQLSSDPEPSVRELAQARVQLVDIIAKLPPSATQPAATQP